MKTQLSTLLFSLSLTSIAACDAEPDDNRPELEERLVAAGAEPGAALDQAMDAMIAVGYDDPDALDERLSPDDQQALAAEIDEAMAPAPDDAHVYRAAIGATVTAESLTMEFQCGEVLTFFVATVGARIDGQARASSKCGALRAHPLQTSFDIDFNRCAVTHWGEYACR